MAAIKSSAGIRGAWPLVVVAHAVILAFLGVIALLHTSSASGLDTQAAIKVMTVILLAVCFWTMYSWRLLSGSVFNLYGLFLIAATIFHCGQVLLGLFDIYSLNTDDFVSLFADLSQATILNTVFLITLGMASLHAGALFSLPLSPKPEPTSGGEEAAYPSARIVRLVGWGFLAVSALPVFIVLSQSIEAVIAYGYLGLFPQGARVDYGPRELILSYFAVPGLLFTLAGSKGLKFNASLLSALALMYCSALLFLGNRHGATMFLVAFAWVFHRSIRPLPKTLLLGVGVFMLFFLFPTLTYFRLETGADRFSLDTLIEVYSSIENPIVAILYELGSTATTVGHTLDLVPGARDFDMGTSYLYALLSILPNLFWESHPSSVHGTLDDWLIYTLDPVTAQALGNSYAFSFIAEAYLNFGWLGAPAALAIIGFLVGWFTLWGGAKSSPARIALVGSTMAFFLIFARGESNEIFRAIAYYAFIPYFAFVFVRVFMTSRRRPNGPRPSPRPQKPHAARKPADDETLSSTR